MKSYLSIFALFIVSSFLLNGEVYKGLKVKGDYKALVVVAPLNIQDQGHGISEKEILTAAKLRLLRNGIKPPKEFDRRSHYLGIEIQILENRAFYIRARFYKVSKDYDVPEKVVGYSFEVGQGQYSIIGAPMTRENFLRALEQVLDDFILDYLESNME